MAAATNSQVQNFSDTRVRQSCEAARNLVAMINDNIAAIDDVYAALTAVSPTWADTRTDGPPHLLTPNDILAINSFWNDIRTAIQNNAQYPIVLKACVRPVLG